MADIDEVLRRAREEAEFRRALMQEPQVVLAGYDLSADDLELLADELVGNGAAHSTKGALVEVFRQLGHP